MQNAVKNCNDLDILLEMLLVCQTNFLPKLAMEIMIKISKTNISSENMFDVLESVSAWKRLGRRDGLETRDPGDVGFPAPLLAPRLHLLAGRASRRI